MQNAENALIKVDIEGALQRTIPYGTTLLDLSRDYAGRFRSTIVAAKVNNDIRELTWPLKSDCTVAFIDLTDEDGMRIYRRSLYFILIKAVNELLPDRKFILSHSVVNGVFCEIRGGEGLTEEEVAAVEKRMHEIVEAKLPFIKRVVPLAEAKALFEKTGRMDRFHAVEYRSRDYVTIYGCDGFDDYFYGYMTPDTGYIGKFALKYHPPGLIVLFPSKNAPDVLPEYREQEKLFGVFKEFKRWGHILGVDNVGDLNDIIKAGQILDFIRISEALHEKKIAGIADMIAQNTHQKKVVLISGPSSSGKTTFAQRLGIQLRVAGLRPITISLDDYFVDREHTPLDENGELDFEALEAIDISLFNQHLAALIRGEEVEIPIFNFHKGRREDVGRKLRIDEDQLMVIEGIHGLNEKLTSLIPREKKFKIYVSALTSMNIDDHNRIPSNDARIIRRIVRDFQFRGSTAVSTIKRWPSVRRGEERNIFPFQEEADVMFNSSMVYELGVLKVLAEPHLMEVDAASPEYSEARRLMEFLSYFLPIDAKEIPANSIIREFIGGSCFH